MNEDDLTECAEFIKEYEITIKNIKWKPSPFWEKDEI
jgi:hypothetical protein